LVMPGGADLPYVRKLRGNANQIIKDYVQNGGSYLGICAGSYYGSSYVAFDPGGPLEVVGKRELGFFEGKAIGPVFGPFDYHSKSGARAALIRTKEATSYFYFNGGPYFENAESYTNTTVLGWYEGDLPAIIHVRYGKGNVILSGVHFEFDPHQVTDEETYPTDVLNKLKISISSLNHQKY
jgi:biotin--protein ligase